MIGGWARDPDRLFLQPRCVLDLPDAGGRVHRRRANPRRYRSAISCLVLGVSLITPPRAQHGVPPGSAIVILAATLNAVPSIPRSGYVLVPVGRLVHRAWRARSANLIGNCVPPSSLRRGKAILDRDMQSTFSTVKNWSTLPRVRA